ncbi:MAG: recombinase family protein, partial [Bacteroidetes bacterium]|nr:recombinase family protein [Bacteroidota bacterium]
MTKLKRVGIWIRVSTDMQVEGDSPEHHEQRARYYIQSKVDWEIAEVYRLDAMSGKSVMDYPETKRMLADVKNGHITGLVFSKLARLARNLKELIEIASYFKQYNADLISLSEAIDTSTAAGRLIYNMLGAVAEFEREEIADRVAASVPIRARLGKPLGGQAPFGYKWIDKDFVIDENESPVRKLMYELFMQYQRKFTTAKELNDRGYRTRNGSHFTATSIERLLRDSTAKGERRANYTKSPGTNKTWTMKPESEWIIIPCEPIVSVELWEQVNSILDSQAGKNSFPARKAVFLLSGFVKCGCGRTMYAIPKSQNYSCPNCKIKISVTDIDEIFQSQLQGYLSGINMSEHVEQAHEQLQERKAQLDAAIKDRNKLAKRMNDLIELRLDGGLSKERYTEQYRPLEA